MLMNLSVCLRFDLLDERELAPLKSDGALRYFLHTIDQEYKERKEAASPSGDDEEEHVLEFILK